MDKNLVLLTLLIIDTYAITFPWNAAMNGTIILKKGQTYEVNTPITWIGLDKVTISGAGATVAINETLKTGAVFTFQGGRTWIWESVKIQAHKHQQLFRMIPEPHERAFVQLRGCYITSESRQEMRIDGTIDHLILENNLFSTKASNSTFLSTVSSDFNNTRFTLKNNQWKGKYTLISPGVANIQAERNKWPNTPINRAWLHAGVFYHPEDEAWCLPPEMRLNGNTTYLACTTTWLLEAINLQTRGTCGPVTFHPVERIIDDEELPAFWNFYGHHDIDFEGNDLEPRGITVMANSTALLRGLDSGWSYHRFEILIKHNATLRLYGLTLKGTDKTLDAIVSTSQSNLFFSQCFISNVNILASGNGHVHVQDTRLKDFLLSADNLWASGSIMQEGKVVTQPYVGHIQYSHFSNTEFHLSPFYLGPEPFYRFRSVRNRWQGLSDMILDPTLQKAITMEMDIIENPRMARKMIYSPNVKAKNLLGAGDNPLFTYTPEGHIWPHNSEKPIKCPDGTTPGEPDKLGVQVKCVPCANPKMSKDGLCQNVRHLDAVLKEIDHIIEAPPARRLGYTFDTSYLNYFTPERVKEDCYRCAEVCLDIPEGQIETYTFTLPQLLEPKPSSKATECSKCALYCADLSGCESRCLPLEWQLVIILAAFLLIIIPSIIVFCVFFRPTTVQVVRSKQSSFFTCPNCEYPKVPGGSNFCPNCGTDASTSSTRTATNSDTLVKRISNNNTE